MALTTRDLNLTGDRMMEATETFTIEGCKVTKGKSRFRSSHWLVQRNPDAFKEVNTPQVEDATAEPGRLRGE